MYHGRGLRLGAFLWLAGMGGLAVAQSPDAEDPRLQACVQEVQPGPRSSPGVSAAGASADVGDLTIIEFDGDYTRGFTAPRQDIATRFYATHPDEYDFLIVFSTFEFETGKGKLLAQVHDGIVPMTDEKHGRFDVGQQVVLTTRKRCENAPASTTRRHILDREPR